MPAPIIIFCYNRASHLQKTIAKLKTNALAIDSDLYIFSDAAKKLEEQSQVNNVRDVIRRIDGFKTVNVTLAKENKGLANSIIEGVSTVINLHDTAIVLEDDILVSQDFLSFMNKALEKYEAEENIYSISGYSFKLEGLEISDEVALVKRASSWGWGTWKSRWNSVDWSVTQFDNFMMDKKSKSVFKDAGHDQLPMLVKQRRGEINSWAVRWTFHHYLNNAYCVVPKYSKVKNIGTDGTGTNFTNSVSNFDTDLHENTVKLPNSIKENPRVTSFIRNYYKPSLLRRIINYYRYGTW